MRVLVTNDDGVAAQGVRALAQVVADAGHEVIVAAPHQEQSGTSASLTALRPGGLLAVAEHELDGLDVAAVGVEASPAFIVFAAMHGAFGRVPELVVSGINHGPNTGHAVLHSGTVGAALTASTFGCRAMAVSLTGSAPQRFDTAAQVAREGFAWVTEHGVPGTVLNLNVPDVAPGELRGVRSAPLASFGAVQAEVADRGDRFVTMTFTEIEAVEDDGTDAALAAGGWATATILRGPCEVPGVDLSGLER
ncbi:5'/3'-nucleotidase SurE [Thalassiella azotivora]